MAYFISRLFCSLEILYDRPLLPIEFLHYLILCTASKGHCPSTGKLCIEDLVRATPGDLGSCFFLMLNYLQSDHFSWYSCYSGFVVVTFSVSTFVHMPQFAPLILFYLSIFLCKILRVLQKSIWQPERKSNMSIAFPLETV